MDQSPEQSRLWRWKEETFHDEADFFAWEALDFLVKSGFLISKEQYMEKQDSNEIPLNLTEDQAQIFRLMLTTLFGKAKVRDAREEDTFGKQHISERIYKITDRPFDQPLAPAGTIARLHLFWDKEKQQPWKFYIDGEMRGNMYMGEKTKIAPVHFMVSQGPIKTQAQVEQLWRITRPIEGQGKIMMWYVDDDRISRIASQIDGDSKVVVTQSYKKLGSIKGEYFIYGCNNADLETSNRVSKDTLINGLDNVGIYGKTSGFRQSSK